MRRAFAAEALKMPHTLFSGYSHGDFGYIPAQSAYAEGGCEVEASPFSPEAHEIIVQKGLAILEELVQPL
ncbi:MAG TPA: hypothetical protein VEN79_14305 [Terriglobia bacterium]|nr:hypothetical protein [Terriglobia bacterium]